LKSKFGSTLLPLELVTKNGIGLGLGGITKGELSSRTPIGFEKIKHDNVFFCPFHKCHLSLSKKKKNAYKR
jgi:hypothetical protein